MERRQFVIGLKMQILQSCCYTLTTIHVAKDIYIPNWIMIGVELQHLAYSEDSVNWTKIKLQFKPNVTSHLCTCFKCKMPVTGHPLQRDHLHWMLKTLTADLELLEMEKVCLFRSRDRARGSAEEDKLKDS